MDAAEFNEFGQWIGPCEKCGTNHDGLPPGTFGGETACLRQQAVNLDLVGLVDQIDAHKRDTDAKRDEALRRYFAS